MEEKGERERKERMLGLTSTETTYGLLGTDEEAGGGGYL